MKVTTRTHLTHQGTGVEFTRAERDTLNRASLIAKRARQLCREVAGGEAVWEDDPQDMTLAHVEHDAAELAEAGFVAAKETDSPLLGEHSPTT